MEDEEKQNVGESQEKTEEKMKENDSNEKMETPKSNDSDGVGPTLTDKLRKEPWMVSTIVLGIIVLIFLVSSLTGPTGNAITGSVVSEDFAGQALLDFANAQGAEAELVGVEDVGDFYEVTLSLKGQDAPLMVTKDGKYFLSGSLVPLESASAQSEPQTADVPKSDKPIVELFVWGYCPYGVQAQGPLAEVASLLEDYADFKAVLYYDGHGAFETQQNKIQECIQKVAPEKYWDYAAEFVTDIYPKCGSSREVSCDKAESIKLMNSLGIDSTAVFNCVDSEGASLISGASNRAKDLGVTGSPTVVINGVKANTARNAEAYKTAVCEAFTEGSAPSECEEVLSTAEGTTSGSC